MRLFANKTKENNYKKKSIEEKFTHASNKEKKHRSKKNSHQCRAFIYFGSATAIIVTTVVSGGVAFPIIIGSACLASSFAEQKWSSRNRKKQHKWKNEKKHLKRLIKRRRKKEYKFIDEILVGIAGCPENEQ